jgi:cell division protein ZapA (FtsZ GTPase activity inhibitor)
VTGVIILIIIVGLLMCHDLHVINENLKIIERKLCQIEKNQHPTNQKPNSK